MRRKFTKKRFGKRRFKRRFFSRRRTRKSTRYDGTVYSKCISTGDFSVNIGATNASVVVSWGNFGVTTAFDQFIDDNPEFVTLAAIYDQYKIAGMKIKVQLLSAVTNVAGTGFYTVHRCSDPNQHLTPAITVADMAKKLDYKAYASGGKGGLVKMYYKVGKFFGKKNLNQGWLNTTQTYADASTLIKMETVGWTAGSVVGKYQITWYVKFKSFK